MSDGVVAEYALGVGLCVGVIKVIFGLSVQASCVVGTDLNKTGDHDVLSGGTTGSIDDMAVFL